MTSYQPPGGITPVDREPNTNIGRMARIQQSLQSKGISDDASRLVVAAWWPGTNSVYNSAWKKWHSWCIGREIDSFCPTLGNITSFLAYSFNEGLEYRTINSYRSALSSVLPPIDGFPVGQHPLVIRLLNGILNLRPAMPRYQRLWDVDTVLTYIRQLSGNDDLSLKIFTHKLSVLLALTAPKRTSELRLLDIRFMRFMRILPEGVEFKLPGMTKTSSDIKTVFFARYEACEQLYVLHCLQSYLVRTKTFRPPCEVDTPNQLLISYHRPRHAVKSSSIARWIKALLTSAGIDTGIFKSHSTRAASTSKARESDLSLEEVLQMANWSGP